MSLAEKVAIVGSRDFPDCNIVRRYIESLPIDTEIVSGGARGVDAWAERIAKERGMPCTVFPADWNKLGKQAGFIRNTQIVNYADRIVAFWDGHSRGTQHTIGLAKKAGKECAVIFDTRRQPE